MYCSEDSDYGFTIRTRVWVAAVSTVKQAVMFSAAYLINNTLRVFSSCISPHGG